MSKERICGYSIAGIAGLNSAEDMDVCVVFCKYREKEKCRTVETKTQVEIKYRVQENTKKISTELGYGPDNMEFESWHGIIFFISKTSRPALGPIEPPI